MSVKTKLSVMIMCIVFLILVLNVILNEYSMRVNLRDDVQARMVRISQQFAESLARHSQGYKLLEYALEDKLRIASIAAADRLRYDIGSIDSAQLAKVASEVGVRQISLLVLDNGKYVVKRSSDKHAEGETLEVPSARSLGGGRDEPEYTFWADSVSHAGSGGENVWKRGYFADADHPYLISCLIDQSNAELYSKLSADIIKGVFSRNAEMVEISGFNPRLFGQMPVNEIPTSASFDEMRNYPVMFGSYSYRTASDIEHVKEAVKKNKPVYDYTEVNGIEMIKSFVPVPGPETYVIGIVMNKQVFTALLDQHLSSLIFISAILLVVVVICSYWLSDILIRPVRSILWKVNEVSFGRFENTIEVNRKDELGQLAERVNAMSKNLGIYMTKLKHAFEENRSMKEYLESFINHTTDAIHVVDLEGRIMRVNRAFEQLFGYTSEEAVGQQLPLVPDHLKTEEQETVEWLKSGKPLSARETVRVTKKGEWVSVSVTTSPIRDKHGEIRAIASITRDMTSRNKMEELLRRSEKLTTVGQLAAGVAHEIRNPLTTLRGFLQLQQETNRLNTRHVDIMLSELDRINLIVSEFLILAKPQATRFQEKDVRFILGDVISLLDSQAHLCDIEFTTDFTGFPCLISCEENQLKQVFINVLKNAIEAMPEGGRIRVAIKHAAAKHVAVSITDHGVGIPEEMIPKLGDPFFTGKETGTGLGLMVSQRIIQSHQGSMDIRSKLGEGTTVTITLPLHDEAGANPLRDMIRADVERT